MREQRALLDQFDEISTKFAEPMDDDEMNRLLEKQGNLQERIDALGLWELDHKIDIAMDALRLPPGDADVAKLSGGERRRVALCRLLLEQPDMLLLDEPTNHLDAESVAWLERYLAEFQGTVVAVTHDRYFLDNVASWILELDRGAGIPWEGNYSSWLEQKQQRLAQRGEAGLGPPEDARSASSNGSACRPRARQAKSKARITALRGAARRRAERQTEGIAEILIPVPERLGDEVVMADELTQGLRRPAPVREPELLAAARRHRRHHRPQRRRQDDAVPDDHRPGDSPMPASSRSARPCRSRTSTRAATRSTPAKTVYEEISGGAGPAAVRQAHGQRARLRRRLQLPGRRPAEEGRHLSGGERNRLHLAKLLKSGGNLLLLDEPTNDLDVDTLRALEEALLGFAGCAVVISHDRWFLDRIATHILAFEGDSEVVWFEGNYQEYAADSSKRKGAAADQPHRIQYKKLVATDDLSHDRRRHAHSLPAGPRVEGSPRSAMNLCWSWSRDARALFRAIDEALWHQPVTTRSSSCAGSIRRGIAACASDPEFLALYDDVMDRLAPRDRPPRTPGSRSTTPTSTAGRLPTSAPSSASTTRCRSTPAASVSSRATTASRRPTSACRWLASGLLYMKGYFDQRLRLDGWQEDSDEEFDITSTPLVQVTGRSREPLLTVVETSGRPVHVRAWRMMVGRVPVYLLDTNLEVEPPRRPRP